MKHGPAMTYARAVRIVQGYTLAELARGIGGSEFLVENLEQSAIIGYEAQRKRLAELLGISEEDMSRPARLVVELVEESEDAT